MPTTDNGTGLWAVFIEAVSPDFTQRTQWLVVSPSIAGRTGYKPGLGRYIKRRMERKGHRAKWKTSRDVAPAALNQYVKSQIEQYVSTGWTIRQPVLIALDEDDYQKMWAGKDASTPYKALRHVEAVTLKRGYRLVD